MRCLLPQYADAFLQGLKKGEIDPTKLSEMSSKERRNFLSKYVGEESAKFVNSKFESNLLLKNQKEGMITWAKNTAGLKPQVRNDLIAKIEKMNKALTPDAKGNFLSDIVEQRLGVQVTAEEAKTITDLTAKLKENFDTRTQNGSDYGKYKQQLVEFMRDHTPPKQYPTFLGKVSGQAADFVSTMRSVKTGFDLSASLRQGAAYFGTKQWFNAFGRMFGYAKSKSAFDELEASMYSNKYSDQAMEVKRDLGLTMLGESFTQREEAFASKFISKVPLLKNSERAYEGFLNDLRFNRFVDVLDQLDKAGNSIVGNKQALKDLAKVIAAATGRGELGALEPSANALATAFFSPRYLVSRFQLISNPLLKKGPARVEAAKSLARMAGITVGLIGLVKMAGGDVETDPRSSDFGKLKVGDTRYDLTGGMSPYIVFLDRFIAGSKKSTATGKITKLNTGEFGSETKFDLFINFLKGKLSPVGGAIRDVAQGEDFNNQKVDIMNQPKETLLKMANNFITPMLFNDVISAYQEAKDNKMQAGVTAGLSSIFGIGVNTYKNAPTGGKWDKLKEEKGEEAYKQAADLYQEKLDEALNKLKETEAYKNAPEIPQENKKLNRADMIDKVKAKVTNSVLGK